MRGLWGRPWADLGVPSGLPRDEGDHSWLEEKRGCGGRYPSGWTSRLVLESAPKVGGRTAPFFSGERAMGS